MVTQLVEDRWGNWRAVRWTGVSCTRLPLGLVIGTIGNLLSVMRSSKSAPGKRPKVVRQSVQLVCSKHPALAPATSSSCMAQSHCGLEPLVRGVPSAFAHVAELGIFRTTPLTAMCDPQTV